MAMVLYCSGSPYKHNAFNDMFFKIKPNPNLKICVIIPVKDEAENIYPCLDALRTQINEYETAICTDYYEILVLTNNCKDHSYSLIKEYLNSYPTKPLQVENIVFPIENAHIGTARRFLMDVAYNRFSFLKKLRGIIASTDGDTIVDTKWLNEIVKEIENGCDVVGGEIITENANIHLQQYHLQDIRYHNLIARLEDLIDPQPYNPWPSHFQCFGASLAVACDLYQKAGRMPLTPFLEDVAFYKALELKDAKIRKSPKVKVYTSSRTLGRVEKGLSQQLAWFELLSNEHQAIKVESSASVLSRLTLKKYLRDCWTDNQIHTIPKPFVEQDLKQWLIEAEYFGELWSIAEEYLRSKQWFNQWSEEPIEKVNFDLEKYTPEIKGLVNFNS